MAIAHYERWLAGLFQRREHEIHSLLLDPSALQFLITWSLFESKCFAGFATAAKLPPFSERLGGDATFEQGAINEPLTHFHGRYQDPERYRTLMHKHRSPKLAGVLAKPKVALESDDRVFLVSFVVYRYRNNIFHGNKGIESWLRYRPQIDLCTKAMQAFVGHAERENPTIAVAMRRRVA